jgi:hypothetical protein
MTMKIMHATAALAALIAMAAPSQAEILYRGIYKVTSVNAACNGALSVGDHDTAQFHPRGLGNENFSAMTTIWSFGASSYQLDSASFTTAYKKVKTGGVGWSLYTNTFPASILLSPVPNITTSTATLTLTGKIKNPRGRSDMQACEVGFRAALYKIVED